MRFGYLCCAVALVTATSLAADSVDRTASIRIDLPTEGGPRVELLPGEDHIVLELPKNAGFPADFAAASNGLLRVASVVPQGSIVRIELEMNQAYLDRVSYEPEAMVLSFRSRVRTGGEPLAASERYRLGPDDRIQVKVHNQEDLSGSLVISRDGWITVPLVGEVVAGGLTPRQLEERLIERFARTFLVDPRVDVEVVDYRSQWVVVGGEVRRAGRIPLRGGTKLKEILGEAEGFTEFAGENINISRKVVGRDEPAVLTVERSEYEEGRSNPPLRNGDIVDVPRAEACYIHGEVRDSGRVRIERGMTLLRVISLAGGLTDWANKKSVTVRHRDGAIEEHNLTKILKGRAPDPPMRGGEVIIVKKRFL
jgi:polysaccharide export outer membrane protein